MVGILSTKKTMTLLLIFVVMKQKMAVAAASPAVVVYCASERTFKSIRKNSMRKVASAGFQNVSRESYLCQIRIAR